MITANLIRHFMIKNLLLCVFEFLFDRYVIKMAAMGIYAYSHLSSNFNIKKVVACVCICWNNMFSFL